MRSWFVPLLLAALAACRAPGTEGAGQASGRSGSAHQVNGAGNPSGEVPGGPAALARARHPAAQVIEEVLTPDGGGRVRLAKDGRHWTLVYSAGGRLLAVREPAPADSLPAAVRAAAEGLAEGRPLALVEREWAEPHGASRLVWRVGLGGGGATRWLAFEPDGSPREPGP